MERRALLIFADSAHTDRKRRGWPSAFGILLEMRGFTFTENKGPQQCDLAGLSGSASTGGFFRPATGKRHRISGSENEGSLVGWLFLGMSGRKAAKKASLYPNR